MASSTTDQAALLKEILENLKALQVNHTQLASNVDAISGRVNILSGIKEVHDAAAIEKNASRVPVPSVHPDETHDHVDAPDSASIPSGDAAQDGDLGAIAAPHAQKPSVTSRIILTYVAYPVMSSFHVDMN